MPQKWPQVICTHIWLLMWKAPPSVSSPSSILIHKEMNIYLCKSWIHRHLFHTTFQRVETKVLCKNCLVREQTEETTSVWLDQTLWPLSGPTSGVPLLHKLCFLMFGPVLPGLVVPISWIRTTVREYLHSIDLFSAKRVQIKKNLKVSKIKSIYPQVSGNVPSAEGFLVEFKGSAGGSGWVTQSVQSSGDAFGSAAENPDSLTETQNMWWDCWQQHWSRAPPLDAQLTACCSSRSPPAVPSTWADPPAAWRPAAGTSPHSCSGKEGRARQHVRIHWSDLAKTPWNLFFYFF